MVDVVPAGASNYLHLSLAVAPGVLPLGSGGVVRVSLVLSVAGNASAGGFGFSIVLTGFGAADSGGSSGGGGGGGGGSVSQTLPSATKAPAAENSVNFNAVFLVAAVAAGAFLLMGKKR
jgi:hypothetical protein